VSRFLRSAWLLPGGLVPAAIVAPAYAVQYLTVEQAHKALFAQASEFTRLPLELSAEQQRAIEAASGVAVRNASQEVWKASHDATPLGWVIIDKVVGKHEFITYALALDAQGAVHGLEIMDYRETYGGQVRDASWRRQFYGKEYGAPLRLDQDIRNISGATLSCRHVSDGVRRLLALHHVVLRAL
jgi:Na+-translocating ferredoxin:NAD+ oxidoreductase RnfG subunit